METRFKKFNVANLIVTVVLSIFCVVEAVVLPVNTMIMPILFAVSVFCNLFYTFYAYQIALRKRYNLMNNYEDGGRYKSEIFDYNVFSCNGIIALSTTVQNVVLLITYLPLAINKQTASVITASSIIFAICTLVWFVSVLLKEGNVQQYIKKTNSLFKEPIMVSTGTLEIPPRKED